MVAMNNLEKDEVVSFAGKTKRECEEIIKRAQTIAHDCDDFMNSLYCYSVKQNLKEIKPIGVVSTILIKKEQVSFLQDTLHSIIINFTHKIIGKNSLK